MPDARSPLQVQPHGGSTRVALCALVVSGIVSGEPSRGRSMHVSHSWEKLTHVSNYLQHLHIFGAVATVRRRRSSGEVFGDTRELQRTSNDASRGATPRTVPSFIREETTGATLLVSTVSDSPLWHVRANERTVVVDKIFSKVASPREIRLPRPWAINQHDRLAIRSSCCSPRFSISSRSVPRDPTATETWKRLVSVFFQRFRGRDPPPLRFTVTATCCDRLSGGHAV